MKHILALVFACVIAVASVPQVQAQIPVYRYRIGEEHQYHVTANIRRIATGLKNRSLTAEADVSVKVSESLDSGDAILSVVMGNVVANYSQDVEFSALTFVPRSQVLVDRYGHVRKVWILEDVPKGDEHEYALRRKFKSYDAVMSVLRYVVLEMPRFSADSTTLHIGGADTVSGHIDSFDENDTYLYEAETAHLRVTKSIFRNYGRDGSETKNTTTAEILGESGFLFASEVVGEMHFAGYVIESKINVKRTH